jgi:MraZ protein
MSDGRMSHERGSYYIGNLLYAVDTSHRLMLPPQWREKGAPSRYYVLPWPLMKPDCLLVLPPAVFGDLVDKLRARPMASQEVANLERLIGSKTSQAEVDKYGRLVVPGESLREAGIEKQTRLVGRLNKFELWNPERLEAAQATAAQSAAAYIEKEPI